LLRLVEEMAAEIGRLKSRLAKLEKAEPRDSDQP
jgi:hypothetical protein